MRNSFNNFQSVVGAAVPHGAHINTAILTDSRAPIGLAREHFNTLTQSVPVALKSPNAYLNFGEDPFSIPNSKGESSSLRGSQAQQYDEVFEKLHSGKTFLRSDPAPVEIKRAA